MKKLLAWTIAVLVVLNIRSVFGAGGEKPPLVRRTAWSYDRANIEWYPWAKKDKLKKEDRLADLAGWAEYDFKITKPGWHELYLSGSVPGWSRDVFIDGKLVLRLVTSHVDDYVKVAHRVIRWKEVNLFLEGGKHTVRFRRLGFPGCLPAWELYESGDNPAACIRAEIVGHNIIRARTKVKVRVTGGASKPMSYTLVIRNEKTGKLVSGPEVAFPASAKPVTKIVEISFRRQGVYRLLARSGKKLLRPADLQAGQIVAIDTKSPPAPASEMKLTSVVDIDCTKMRSKGFVEKDGKTRIVRAPFGAYRESSGKGSHEHWGTDGFAYSFDLPDTKHIYKLVVDYPDDDRRTMGFWVNDGALIRGRVGLTLCGGVETGGHYTLSNKMQTHEAFFYPRNNKGLVVAAINLVPGSRAAASRIRIFRVDSALTAAPPVKGDGRVMGYYFEESGRWIRQFGGPHNTSLDDHIKTMERWGRWNRHIGANLMMPTINVYQANHYPSRILIGYFNRTYDECRMNALIAEKYGCKYIPEFHISGQTYFDKHTMKVWMKDKKVQFGSPKAREYVMVSKDGKYKCSWKPFVYNALHPRTQELYISVFGELADRLGDCESFGGISSRLMLGWQWMGWNALPGLNWGYGDWTIAQFEKETGIKVPVNATGPKRFRARFDFLTGPMRDKWIDWRCRKIFDYHCRLRDRIRKAKPTARLFLPYYGPDPREAYSRSPLGQMREIGMDWKMYADEPGIVVTPTTVYGRRFSTPVLDATKREPLLGPDSPQIARLGDRGFGLYGDYFELNKNLDWTKLGGKPYPAFDSCVPSGIHERELYAQVLAESDCSFIFNGGNGWIFGTPKVLSPFLREYRSLPARPFKPFDKARDPVAIWYRQEKGGMYFYAVNRLPCEVTAKVDLSGATAVTALGDGTEKACDGSLSVKLAPFMMKSFFAKGRAALAGCSVNVPNEQTESLKPPIAFARDLRKTVASRREAVELTHAEANRVLSILDESLAAFSEGRLWRARGNLERQELVRLYDMIGRYPPGLFHGGNKTGFVDSPKAPKLTMEKIIGDVRGKMSAISDLDTDDDGSLYAASPEQIMIFSPGGEYSRSLRLARPHIPDKGGLRNARLFPPTYHSHSSLRVLPDGMLAVVGAYNPLIIYERKLGRIVERESGAGFVLPSWHCNILATDSKGNLYVGCSAPKESVGVWKYTPSGSPAFDFGGANRTNRLCAVNAAGLAVDDADRLYVSNEKGVNIYTPDGKAAGNIAPEKSIRPGRIAVSPDGKTLVVATDKGGAITGYQRTGDKFTKAWTHDFRASTLTALAFSGNTEFVAGFKNPVDGAVAVRCKLSDAGIGETSTAIASLEKTFPNVLEGYTQLKYHKRNLWFLSGNKLMRMLPGGRARVAFDPRTRGMVQSFAFLPNGDLLMASNFGFYRNSRGTNVYLCRKKKNTWEKPVMINGGKPLVANWSYTPTDIAVDKRGRLIIRHWPGKLGKRGPTVAIYAITLDGAKVRKTKELIHLGSTLNWGSYGLHVDKKGRVFVAGGGTRSLSCVAGSGKLLWQTRHYKSEKAGSVPMRKPIAVTTDSRGRAWVADMAGNRILCFGPDGKSLASYGNFGTIDDRDGFSFCEPTGVAVVGKRAGSEKLYVADSRNQRIVIFRIADATEQ